jgi:hypothetical protein
MVRTIMRRAADRTAANGLGWPLREGGASASEMLESRGGGRAALAAGSRVGGREREGDGGVGANKGPRSAVSEPVFEAAWTRRVPGGSRTASPVMGSRSFDPAFRAGRLAGVIDIDAAVAGSADSALSGGVAASGWPRSDGRTSKATLSTGDRSGRILDAAPGSTLRGDRDPRTVVGASFLAVAAAVGVAASAGRAKTGREGRFGDPLGRRQTSEERDANSASEGVAASSRRRAGRKPGVIGAGPGGGPSANIEPGATAMSGSGADNLSASLSAGADDISTASAARDMRSATKVSQWAGASG